MKQIGRNISYLMIIIIASTILLLVAACTNKQNPTEIKMIDSKIGYGLSGKQLVITYDSGENWVRVLSTKVINPASAGFFITPDMTAIVINGQDQNQVLVKISKDKGKTWNSVVLPNNKKIEPELNDQSREKYIGFTSPKDGWIVTTGAVAMGMQHNFVYKTVDGGKTWTLAGSTDKVYSRVVTGAGFANKDIGFIGFRYEDKHEPTVYMTTDGGINWTLQSIPLPQKYKEDCATPLSPVFNKAEGKLPVKLRDNNIIIEYRTTDYGLHWNAPKD